MCVCIEECQGSVLTGWAYMSTVCNGLRAQQMSVYGLRCPSPPDVPSIGFPAFLKAVIKMTGMDLGPPRLPMLPISPDAYKRLESELKDIGFFDWS